MALGEATPIFSWLLHHVKAANLMRFPVKFVILPVFALPLLAAYGLTEKPPAKRGLWLWIWIVPVLFIAVIVGAAHRYRTPNDDYEATLGNALMRVAFLAGIAGGLFSLNRISQPRLRPLVQVLVLLFVWLDLYCQLPQPPDIRRVAYTMNVERNFNAPKPGISRAAIPDDVRYHLIFATDPDVTQDFIGHRFTLFCNCNLLDDIPKCDGFFPLYVQNFAGLPTNNAVMLDFLGVSEILAGKSNTVWWQPRSTSMPLLTGGQKCVFASDATTLQMLTSTNFDPRTEVFLPLEAKNSLTAPQPGTVKITPEIFLAQCIKATVETGTPAMLVAAQTYYHPWRAYVDGKPVPLWRANFAFQALEVPAGSHHVTLVYEDRKFYLGAIISLTTLAGCLVCLGLATLAGRKYQPRMSTEG